MSKIEWTEGLGGTHRARIGRLVWLSAYYASAGNYKASINTNIRLKADFPDLQSAKDAAERVAIRLLNEALASVNED